MHQPQPPFMEVLGCLFLLNLDVCARVVGRVMFTKAEKHLYAGAAEHMNHSRGFFSNMNISR